MPRVVPGAPSEALRRIGVRSDVGHPGSLSDVEGPARGPGPGKESGQFREAREKASRRAGLRSNTGDEEAGARPAHAPSPLAPLPMSKNETVRLVGLLLLAAGCRSAPAARDAAWAVEPATPASAAVRSDAGEDDALDGRALAQLFENPVAPVFSVGGLIDFDDDVGPSEGELRTIAFDVMVPISLGDDWNLISRTSVPLISLDDVAPGQDESGLGDVLELLYFAPVEPTDDGTIWGVGPAIQLPTASEDVLGTEQLSIGPALAAIKQEGPWTYGGEGWHLWSVAGDDDRADVNATFLEPYLVYTTDSAWSFRLDSEAFYDWESENWFVPITGSVAKVLRLGGVGLRVGAGLRYWAETPDSAGPEGLGFRFDARLLWP